MSRRPKQRSFYSKLTNKQQPNLSLTVWGTNLPSNVGCRRFTKQISNMIKLPPFQYSVVVGLLLSDGYLFMGSTQKNARLGLEQSVGGAIILNIYGIYFLYYLITVTVYQVIEHESVEEK